MTTWNELQTTKLAKPTCRLCKGKGMIQGARIGTMDSCGCVLRQVFRECLERFKSCTASIGSIRGATYGRRNEEYIADLWLIAHRVLSGTRLKVFKLRFLMGADETLCIAKLGISRGKFYHEAYRVEEILGEAFRETQPYALFPPDQYFAAPLKVRAPKAAA